MITAGDNGVSFGPAHALGVSVEDTTAFYRGNWPRRIALSLPRFYTWQFLEAPEDLGKDWNCVAVRGGEILGIMGLNRRSFRLGQETLRGAELTTWVVAEAARGLGVGRGLMGSIQAQHDLTVGFGISAAALPIYMTTGYRRLKHIPRYFRILAIEPVRPHAKIDRLGEVLAKQWQNIERPGFSAKPVTAEELGGLGTSMEQHHKLFVRNNAQLAWRYDRHPVYKYEAFAISPQSGGPPRTGVVLRQDSVDGMRFMHVLDILGDPEQVPLALAFVDDFARASGQCFIDFYCTSTAITGQLLASGWLSGEDDDCFQLSHLYYPPELRTPQTTSMVYWTRSNMGELADLGRLYLTKQDLDLDRPTLEFYEKHNLAAM